MVRDEGDPLVRVVVCSPQREYFKVPDLANHGINEIADRDRAQAQHLALRRAMEALGVEVTVVTELEGHPNSVFTRDVALCTSRGYVRLRMGLPTRRGEEGWMASQLDDLGVPCLAEIGPPGTVEGGDVILAGDVAFLGCSERTNQEGVRQLQAILAAMGYEIRVADVRGRSMHIGGAMSLVAPGRVVCCADVFPDGFFDRFDVIEVPSESGPVAANVICLRKNEVIADPGEHPETIPILESRGVRVHELDLSEFRKGAGGPTCLILPVQRSSPRAD
jgi:dimethylargininase